MIGPIALEDVMMDHGVRLKWVTKPPERAMHEVAVEHPLEERYEDKTGSETGERPEGK
jgi:hypothetical protein